MTQGWRSIRAIPAGIAVLALLSCSEDRREIQDKRVLRPISGGIRWNVDAADRFGMRTAPQAPMFGWDLPEGWISVPASEFRQADFRVTAQPGLECYLSVVGGGAVANLNRWRGQMGLSGYTPAEIQDLEKRNFLGAEALYVEMEGTFTGMGQAPQENSLLAGLVLEAGTQTLTLKFVGPADGARSELDNFKALADSFRLGSSGQDPHATMGPGAAPPATGTGSGAIAWEAPEGWRPSPPRPMTEVAFELGESTSCWISILGFNGGGADANIQRWRAEMGNAPVSAQQTIPMFGTQGTMIEIRGRFGGNSAVAPIEDATMLAVSCGLGDRTVFVKMIGPRAEVQAHHQEFLEFCASLSE